jgi:hypothetical protein
MKPKQIVLIVVALLVLGALALFYVQNMEQRTPLYFDLGIWGVQLESKVPVPALMYISFAVGAAVMGVFTLLTRLRRERRQRFDRDFGPTNRDPGSGERGLDDYDF